MGKNYISSVRLLVAGILCVLFFSVQGLVAEKSVRIMFTNDMHASFLPFDTTDSNGVTSTVGGYARLKTSINTFTTPESVLLDAGDFAMGTFFNLTFKTNGSALQALNDMGYTATTIGNHEFDYLPSGLAQALEAVTGSDKRPAMLISNMQFSDDPKAQELKSAMDTYGAKKYMIIERNGVKIGLFGMLGPNAQSYTETAHPITFQDTVLCAQEMVTALKGEGAQLVVLLSHGGTSQKKDKSEDELLAKAVPGIDVIISGHTHSVLEKPLQVGNTVIVSAGARGEYLGVLDLLVGDGTYSVESYKLVHNDASVAEDAQMLSLVAKAKKQVEEKGLQNSGFGFDTVLTVSEKNFTSIEKVDNTFEDSDIGNFITDSQLYEARLNGFNPGISAINSGLIRDTLQKGPVTASNVYNIASLGAGADGTIGFPLVQIFVTGAELRGLCEVDVSVFPLMSDAQLFFTGVRYTYNQSRMIFNKALNVEVQASDGSWKMVDDSALYGIVCPIYLGQMTGLVTKATHGILNIAPRDAQGVPLTDLNSAILHDSQGHELKQWLALTHYMQTFPKNADGVRVIPAVYNSARNGKVAVQDFGSFFVRWNKVTIIAYSVIFVLVALLSLLVVVVVRKISRRAEKR